MALSRKTSALIVVAVFIGVLAGLIIASNLDWTERGIASDRSEPAALSANPSEAIPQESADASTLARAINELYVGIVQRVSPSVVTITTTKRVEGRSPLFEFFGDRDLFRRFFDFDTPQQDYLASVLGSGVIVKSDGHLLTNYHVVKDAEEVRVMLGREEFDAKIIGSDPKTDVAVLKIEDSREFPVARFGDSDELQIGEVVLAFGTPFNPELARSVSRGIVSAKGRGRIPIEGSEMTYFNFIQTDAAINPGNSGGPLVNLHGEIVGLNTAIVGQANVGIGFAIPGNMAKWVMEQLIEKGEVTRGWLGVLIQNVTASKAKAYGLDKPRGILIAEITENGPAEKYGLKEEDIILKIDNTVVDDIDQLSNLIATTPPGTKVRVVIWRDGKEREIVVELGELSEDAESRPSSRRTSSKKFGITVRDLTEELAQRYGYEENEGVLVAGVERGSDAEREGLRVGALIKEVNHNKVRSVREFEEELDKVEPGDAVLLRVEDSGRNLFVALPVPKE